MELFNTEYENYKVTKCGKVWSVKSSKYLKQFQNVYKYLMVTINGKNIYVHQLVLNTFVPKPFLNAEIDHIDRNNQNNSLSNLRWVTKSENNKNRLLKFNGNKQRLNQKDIDYILKSNYSQVKLANLFKVSVKTIRRIIVNKGYLTKNKGRDMLGTN